MQRADSLEKIEGKRREWQRTRWLDSIADSMDMNLSRLQEIVRASQVVLVVKNPPANAGDARDVSSIPKSGRSLGEGNVNPLQYSYLRNPMDMGAWWATVHGGHKESDMTEQHPQGCTPQNLLHCVRCTVHSKQQAFSVTHINTHMCSVSVNNGVRSRLIRSNS